jgi:glycosyltransferase involved in cell wall biosynthesis
MLTLEETLASQNNLYQLCAVRPFEIHEIFSGNAFYGHDFILKKYTDLPLNYPLKAIIPHGIYLSDAVWEPEIQSTLPVIFSYPSYREQAYIHSLEDKGIHKVVIPVASPFLYLLELLKENPKPERKGTILFPAHSTHFVTSQADWESLAEELINLPEEFQPITACIYWRDIELGQHLPFQRRGMRIVSAGHMLDWNFLFRFYHLCSIHRYSTSNEFGSHIFFSIKAGCSYFHLDKIKCSYTAANDEILKRDAPQTPENREKILLSLFKNPQSHMNTEQMEIVDYYLGTKYLKSPEELRQQLLDIEDFFQKKVSQKPIVVNSTGRLIAQEKEKLLPSIVIDGILFQFSHSKSAKFWKYLLQEWSKNGFGNYITVIDRNGTAPKIPSMKYCKLPFYDYKNIEFERKIIQQVCDQERADLFISTHYTIPSTTPSVFIEYDIMPERMGCGLNHPMFREKQYSLENATAYIAISQNTAHNLIQAIPDFPLEPVTVVENGINQTVFSVATQEKINCFRTKYGIYKPYFIIVADSMDYKNSILFFQAFAQLVSHSGFDIICTDSNYTLPPELRNYTTGSTVHILDLDDEELATAYSGAISLVYPSKYGNLSLPVLESMACGCPIIAGNNPSILEVAGAAAIYVEGENIDAWTNALCDVQKPTVRYPLIAAALQQVKKFSVSEMANVIISALIDATLLPLKLKDINFIIFPDWSLSEEEIALELERVIKTLATHPESDRTTLLIDTHHISSEDAELLLSSITMNLLMQDDLDITEGLEISLIGDLAELQWKALLPRIRARIVLKNESTITQMRTETLSYYYLNNLNVNK